MSSSEKLFGSIHFWNRSFHGFFRLFVWTSQGKSVDTTEKRASKMSQLWGAVSSWNFNKSLWNLVILLILRRSFECYRRIFPNLSMSKVEKKHEKVYWLEKDLCSLHGGLLLWEGSYNAWILAGSSFSKELELKWDDRRWQMASASEIVDSGILDLLNKIILAFLEPFLFLFGKNLPLQWIQFTASVKIPKM